MKKGEKAVIDSKDTSARLKMNYQALLENTGIAIVIIDKDGKYLFANSTATSPLDCDVQNVIGKTMSDFLPPEIAERYLERNRRMIHSGGSEVYEATFDLPSGGRTFLINDQVLKDDHGNGFAIQSSSIDITDRKKAEKAQNEIEERFRYVFESSNVPQSITFLTGELNVNQAFCDMFGYSEDELKKKKWQELTFHEEIETDLKLIDSVLKGERGGVRRVKRYVHKNGSILWGDVSYALIRDSEGNPLHFITTIVDITERKKTEDALRESEQKWHLLVETIPDYVALYDADGKYLFLNHFAEGFSAKDIEGKYYTDFLDEKSKTIYGEAFRKAKETKQTQYIEYTALGDHYSIRHYESFFVPIFENAGLVNMLVIARDITERKVTEKLLAESEANARAIMESTDDVLVLLDKNGILIDCNKTHARRLNKTREELLGKCIFDELPADVATSRREAVTRCISTRECVYGEDIRFGRCIEYTVHPIFSENGMVEKVAIFARDVTKRKQNEQVLQDNELRLRELNATKDKFFSIIAHDLKSPFNSIIGFSSLLARHVNEGDLEGIRRYATIIQDSSQQALDLLLNLLEWSRSQTGKIEFTPEEADISALISQSVDVLIGGAQQKQIAIHTQMPANLVARVDKAMLNIILRNLLSNAIKFTRLGGEIAITAQRNANQLQVSVTDNGIGISKDASENLFKIHRSQTTMGTLNEKGTGLGLILCKEFVDKHGGKIWVESQVDRGSKFTFTIPQPE